jgi:hypothetical protein
MTTPTLDTRIATRRAELTKLRAAIPEAGKLPLSTTYDEAAAIAAQRQEIDAEIKAFNTAVETWEALPTLERDQRWFDFATTAHATIEAQRSAMHPRIRNEQELEQSQRLKFSLELLDRGFAANRLQSQIMDLSSTRIGELMAAAGFLVSGPELRSPYGWQGSLKETADRLRVLTRQRAQAQVQLDLVLRTAEERAAQAAEDQVFHAALRTMDLKNGPDGCSLVAFTKDGDPLPVAEMAVAQRKAFERFARAAVPREVEV